MFSCTSKPQIQIFYDLLDKKEKLIITSNQKSCSFGCIFFANISLDFLYGGTRIQSLSLFNKDNNLLWKISAIDKYKGGRKIFYGEIKEHYKQEYPENNIQPEELIKNNVYKVQIDYSGQIIEKEFIFYRSVIYMDLEEVDEKVKKD